MGCTINDYEPIGNKVYVVGNTNPISDKVMLAGVKDGMRPYSSGSVNSDILYSIGMQSQANYKMSGLKYGVDELSESMKGIDSKIYIVGEKVSDVSSRISRLEFSNDLLREHVGRLENLLEELTTNMRTYVSKRVSTRAYPVVYDGLAAVVEEVPNNVVHVDFSKKKDNKERKAA